MTKQTRVVILMICLILFFTITPWLIFCSLGYKFDFKNLKVVAMGGIYIRAEQFSTEVMIDSKIDKKTNFFSNSIFIQNLLPGKHKITVKKDGYFYYIKNVEVKEKEVTKIENITLFKNNLVYNEIDKNIVYSLTSPNDKFIFLVKSKDNKSQIGTINISGVENKNLIDWPVKNGKILNAKWSEDSKKVLIESGVNYFIIDLDQSLLQIFLIPQLAKTTKTSFNPQNSDNIFFVKNNQLYSLILSQNYKANTIPIPASEDVVSYQIYNDNIIWLGLDGNLRKSDIYGKNIAVLSKTPLLLDKNNSYKVFANNFGVFILKDKSLFILDQDTEFITKLLDDVNTIVLSPDKRNILYATNNEIWLNHSNYEYNNTKTPKSEKILLNKFYENIFDVLWLNNNYLIFKADNKIKISEIDNRNNININDLPINFTIQNSSIYFNEQDKKLYILSGDNLFASEKLLP